MASRQISTGIDKLVDRKTEKQRIDEARGSRWLSVKQQIDGLLLATKQYKSNEVMDMCRAIEQLGTEKERYTYVAQHWGPMYADKVHPLLVQLSQLERELSE